MRSMRNSTLMLGAIVLALAGCSDDPVADDTAAAAKGNGVCLQTSQIDHTEILNDTAILFYMKTGKPYLNTMHMSCPSLKMEDGFAYESEIQEVCSNSQTIRVLRSGNFCELGQFTPFDVPKVPEVPAKS